jgi:phosphotriesterase-related protein
MSDPAAGVPVRTVAGVRRFDPDAGHVLPHEHIWIDLRVWWERDDPWQLHDEPPMEEVRDEVRRQPQATVRENLVLADWYLAAAELDEAREHGCQLVVDLTVDGLDPRPSIAAKAANLAGLDLVVGLGRYLAEALPPHELDRSVDELVDDWVRRAEEGVDGAAVGVIGEIGTGERLAPAEITSLRAAARTQRATGLAINVHVHPYARTALDALRILDAEGADLGRVAISHCDGATDVDWLLSLLDTGCYVEFDQLGTGPSRLIQGRGYPSDDDRLNLVETLADAGHADRLLLSHDICMRNSLRRYGGWGYAHLGETLLPRMRARLGDKLASHITAHNPLRLLSYPAT